MSHSPRYIPAVEVAKLIRTDLKSNFPETKFSVKTPRGGSIRVAWTDGPTTATVKSVVDKYEGQSFDAMQDLREPKQNELNGEAVRFGSAFVFCNRAVSNEYASPFADYIYNHYSWSTSPSSRTIIEKDDFSYMLGDDYNTTTTVDVFFGRRDFNEVLSRLCDKYTWDEFQAYLEEEKARHDAWHVEYLKEQQEQFEASEESAGDEDETPALTQDQEWEQQAKRIADGLTSYPLPDDKTFPSDLKSLMGFPFHKSEVYDCGSELLPEFTLQTDIGLFQILFLNQVTIVIKTDSDTTLDINGVEYKVHVNMELFNDDFAPFNRSTRATYERHQDSTMTTSAREKLYNAILPAFEEFMKERRHYMALAQQISDRNAIRQARNMMRFYLSKVTSKLMYLDKLDEMLESSGDIPQDHRSHVKDVQSWKF